MIETTVFQQGNSSAVRLIGDCKISPGTKVRETRTGDVITIELVHQWSTETLGAIGAMPELELELPNRDSFVEKDLF